jgi:hypothetical protein
MLMTANVGTLASCKCFGMHGAEPGLRNKTQRDPTNDTRAEGCMFTALSQEEDNALHDHNGGPAGSRTQGHVASQLCTCRHTAVHMRYRYIYGRADARDPISIVCGRISASARSRCCLARLLGHVASPTQSHSVPHRNARPHTWPAPCRPAVAVCLVHVQFDKIDELGKEA